jgi:hydrogenase maturation protein HypF
MAVAHQVDAGLPPESFGSVTPLTLKTVLSLIEKRFNSPMTSSAGRLFDAVAALAGIRSRVTFEGQAAMQLEWLAIEEPADSGYPFSIQQDRANSNPMIVDTRPLIAAICRDRQANVDARRISRRFHTTMTNLITEVCELLRKQHNLHNVALSGGCFMNTLLLSESAVQLESAGFRVLRHRLVPANDGGLSLGQLAIAAAHLDAGLRFRK